MRALVPFLAVVTLFVAAVSFEGCGKPPCTPANCKTGCCDAMNTCQPGTLNVACGANGAMCAMCTLAQTCAAGLNQCVTASTGGGGGQGGGGGGGGQGGGGGNIPANSCNTSGVAMGCPANGPFSCAAAANCYATLAECAMSGQCPPGGTGGGGGGGGTLPANSCNTSGVAMGCPANGPFSCAAAANCYATLAECAMSGQCPPGGTGGGGGPTTTCNTTGVAAGCMSNAPFSCAASNMCFTTFDGCVQSGQC
ncbi:MAG: hypothetical protein JNM17_37105 [Archangium sp.]|nr:hypothetical protein [Archangium sp.]